ncbi:uncharacterized protein LOC118750672 [Rhagoletis pomonella]|uniref:uncharacterized protein LOC118750655 n=1 Tax=Rhagoletis pomonella TaxID=28610 RepID=UPI001780BF88|nr:uncharacterized protein LOC118750655 [Rhagoletis pomonella]XP_036341300.1 uncharacterized protein LOC118750672 [Rhagoletis pomonella]
MQTMKRERKRYQKDTAPADDIITLIHLVRQNPALYNYKLQPNQRRRIDVLNGWADIAAQIGNKYTVEECRRKWKNLRDTYHQYRLRKPKLGDGLSKWRYAKELEFLSTVYQPKLKSQRHQNYMMDTQRSDLHDLGGSVSTRLKEDHIEGSIVHHSNSGITLVNDDETFILTTYEESVADDVTTIDHGGHEDPSISSHMELTHDDDDDVEDVQEIVKNEHGSSLDDANGTEVHYEEVCMYEEAGNGPSVDCETIIGAGGVVRSSSTDSKNFTSHHHHHTHSTADSFTYSMNDFCIESIPHLPSTSGGGGESGGGSSNSSVIGGTKLKNLATSTIVTTPVVVSSSSTNPNIAQQQTATSSILQLQSPTSMTYNGQSREELDLFFAFLKQKMQRFSKEEITLMQVEFLNCVQKHEAERKYNGGGGGDSSILHQ